MINREDCIKALELINCRATMIPNSPIMISPSFAKSLLAVIKNQEAEVEIEGGGSTWFYVCGECHTSASKHSKYCCECGRRLKWENITLK